MEKKEFVNPFILFATIWIVCLIVIESGLIKYIPLTEIFYICLFLSLISFGISYFFTTFILNSVVIKSKRILSRGVVLHGSKKFLINVVFFLLCTLICLHAYNFISIVGGFDLGLYRSLITDEGQSVKFGGLITLLNPFAYLSIVLLLVFNASRLQFFLVLLLLLVFFVLSTGRSSFLVVTLLTGWFLYFKGVINRKMTILLASLFFIFFATMGVVLGKLSTEVGEYMFLFINESVPINWFTIALFNLLSYMTSGIVAFSDYAATTAPVFEVFHTGKNVFKVFAPFLEKPPEFAILPNAYVPFPTNVYTFFFPAYADFGLVGVIVVFIIYGFIGSVLYSAFHVYRTEYYAGLLAIFYTVISLSVFHDYVFSSIFPYSCFLLLFALRKKLNRKI